MSFLPFLRDNAPFLAAGFLLTFGSATGQTFFISLFSGEIMGAFNLSHAAWGQLYAVATLASAAVMVWSGALTDRFRIRSLGAIILCGTAFACLFMAWTPAIWALLIAVFLLRLTGQGMMSHLGSIAMARWFVATRGRALSVAGLGFAVAEAALPILIVVLLTFLDWRFIWVGCAVFAIFLLPILSKLLRLERTPQAIASETNANGMDNKSWTRPEVFRGHLFWFVVPALLGPAAFNTAFFFQQVHFAEIKGWSHLQLVALFPIYTVAGVIAMFASGFLVDKIGTARLMPLYQLPMVGAFAVYAYAQDPLWIVLGLMLMSITAGANSTIPTAFWAEFYGTRYLGSIKAMAVAIMVLGSAIGPAITGSLITAGVGLETQMLWISGYFTFVCLSAFLGIRSVATRLTSAS